MSTDMGVARWLIDPVKRIARKDDVAHQIKAHIGKGGVDTFHTPQPRRIGAEHIARHFSPLIA